MATARVFNDNVHPYRETFKGTLIEIPVGGSVDMDFEEALQFEGTARSMIKNAGGQQCPTSFKKLRVVPLSAVPLAPAPLICHATGKVAADAAELARWNAENEHLLHDDAKDTVEALKAKDAEIASLRAQLEATAVPTRGKPGRPRKDASA